MSAYQRMREQLQRYRDALAQRRTVLYSIENGNGQLSVRPMTRFETRALLDAMQVSPHGPMPVLLVGLDQPRVSVVRPRRVSMGRQVEARGYPVQVKVHRDERVLGNLHGASRRGVDGTLKHQSDCQRGDESTDPRQDVTEVEVKQMTEAGNDRF